MASEKFRWTAIEILEETTVNVGQTGAPHGVGGAIVQAPIELSAKLHSVNPARGGLSGIRTIRRARHAPPILPADY